MVAGEKNLTSAYIVGGTSPYYVAELVRVQNGEDRAVALAQNMTCAKQVAWQLSCVGLFSLLLGCSQSSPPTNAGPTRPPAEPPVRKKFDFESGPHVAGKKVLVAHGCFRCHSIDQTRGPVGNAEGGDEKLLGAVDLTATGNDPERTVEWFMDFVRNPGSTKMPKYEGKINDKDLRALAEYLSSLKGEQAP